MRVLRIYHSAVVGEFRRRDQLLRDRHGHEMHLICPPRWDEGGATVEFAPRADDVCVHVVEPGGSAYTAATVNLFWFRQRALEAVIREVRPELVDIHEEPYSLASAGILWAIGRAAPKARVCVYTAQNMDKRYPPPFSVIERAVLHRAGAAYPCTVEAGERLRRRGFTGDIHVLPLGVSVPAPRRSPAGAPLKVGFVGRCEPYKGAGIALDAFAAATENRDVDATFTIVGDGSELPELRARASALGIAGRVHLTGALDQDATLSELGTFDVVLVPSLTTPVWKEQFGRVASQALVAGAVVIASDSGSLREVVGDGGVLVPEGDTAAFARHLRTLLENAGLRRTLAERGRRGAEARLSWEAVADGVDRMYRGARVREA